MSDDVFHGRTFTTKDSGERETFTTGAKRDTRTGKGRWDLLSGIALKRLAQLLERGAVKYGPNNWKKGMPLRRYLDSATRHLFQLIEGETDEDHAAAVMFNIMCFIHTKDQIDAGNLPKELDDLDPHVEEELAKKDIPVILKSVANVRNG